LGLAIVRSIMSLHSGTAQVQSRPGAATVFSLVFPVFAERH
jgi:two-component system heavy metal sensor histidine kinase CusS